MKKRPTLKDIAKKSGVDQSTVSRVINNSPVVGEGTRDKVLKVVKSLNYQPNLIARSLVKKSTRSLALITPVQDPHAFPIIRGIADTCKRFNYGLMLFSTDYWADEEISYVDVARNWVVDGILIYNILYRKDVAENISALQKEGTPVVFINKYKGINKVNTVCVDNRDAVMQVMTHLVNLGHKRIGILNGSLIAVDGVERFEGYKEALQHYQLEYDENIVGYADFSDIAAFDEMKRILCLASRPTAMFCANDLMAMGAIKAIEEKGFKVPQDMAIVGFDDGDESRFFKPALTTVRPPLEDIGGKAINLIMKLIQNPKREAEETVLKARLIVRQTSVA